MYVHIHIYTYLCIHSTVVHMNKCESAWYKNTHHGRDANNCRDVTSDSWLTLSTNFPSMGFQSDLRMSLFYSTWSRLCHYIVQWIHSFRQPYCQLLGLARFVLTMVMSFRHGHGAVVQKIGYSRIIYSNQRIWSWYFEKARWNHVCGKGRMDLTSKRQLFQYTVNRRRLLRRMEYNFSQQADSLSRVLHEIQKSELNIVEVSHGRVLRKYFVTATSGYPKGVGAQVTTFFLGTPVSSLRLHTPWSAHQPLGWGEYCCKCVKDYSACVRVCMCMYRSLCTCVSFRLAHIQDYACADVCVCAVYVWSSRVVLPTTMSPMHWCRNGGLGDMHV